MVVVSAFPAFPPFDPSYVRTLVVGSSFVLSSFGLCFIIYDNMCSYTLFSDVLYIINNVGSCEIIEQFHLVESHIKGAVIV